jgi:hypothetical protein
MIEVFTLNDVTARCIDKFTYSQERRLQNLRENRLFSAWQGELINAILSNA